MFVLFELLFTEHLSAAFRILVVLGLIYTLLLVVTWAMALFHPDAERRVWAERLLDRLQRVPRAVAEFFASSRREK